MGVLGKKLLVLDVNGLLVDTYYQADTRPERRHDKKVNKFYVYNRPFCDEFIHFCLENFVVGVWSSALEHNVRAIVDYVFEESKEKLAFIWHQKHCTDTGFRHPDNKYKPLFLKELWRLWKKIEPNLPWNEGDFNPSNTILIDDSPYKAINNPPHTAIFPKSYNASDVSDNYLAEELQTYLEGLLDTSDVQAYIRGHPIGEPCIAVGDPQWSHVLNSVKFKIEGDWEVPDLWLGITEIRSPKHKQIKKDEDAMVVKAAAVDSPLSQDDTVEPLHRNLLENPPSKVLKDNNHRDGRNGHSVVRHRYPLPHNRRDVRHAFAESDIVVAGFPQHVVEDEIIASDPAPPGVEIFSNMQGHGMDPRMPHRDFVDARRQFTSNSDWNYARPLNGPHLNKGFVPLHRVGERPRSRHPYDRVANGNYSVVPNLQKRPGDSEGWSHSGRWGNALQHGEYMTSPTSRMSGDDRFRQEHMPWHQHDLLEGRSYPNDGRGFPPNASGPHFTRQQTWFNDSPHSGRSFSGRGPDMTRPPPRRSEDRHWEHVDGRISRRDNDGRYSPREFSTFRDNGHDGRLYLKSNGNHIIQVRGSTDPSDWVAREREDSASWFDRDSKLEKDEAGHEMVACDSLRFPSDDPMRGRPYRRNLHPCDEDGRKGRSRAAGWNWNDVEPPLSSKSYGRQLPLQRLLEQGVTFGDHSESLYDTSTDSRTALYSRGDRARSKRLRSSEDDTDGGLGRDDRGRCRGLRSDSHQAEDDICRLGNGRSIEKGNYRKGWSTQVGREGTSLHRNEYVFPCPR